MFSRTRGLLLIALLTLVGLALFVRLGHAQKDTDTKAPTPDGTGKLELRDPVVGQAVKVAETVAIRDLPGTDAFDPEAARKPREVNRLNTVVPRKPRGDAKPQPDGALQATWTPQEGFQLNIPSPSLTFEGIPVLNSAPPDTTGAVGPNDYVQSVNGCRVQVWDKNGVPRTPAVLMSTLFAKLGGICSINNQGDPLVLYDRLANRWIISQFAFTSQTTPPFHQCVAVSKTGDPAGEYWTYDFITPGNNFPDYGKFGVWPDAYYFTDRQFPTTGGFNGHGAFAFDRAKMLVGDPSASYIYFSVPPAVSNSSSGMIPTDFYGLTPPPAGSPNVFAIYVDDVFDGGFDALRLFNFRADFATPANSTFTERAESPLAVAPFDSRAPGTQTGTRNEIEQPPPATPADYLNAISDRLMLRLFYINRGGQELFTTVHTVNAGTIPAGTADPTIAQYEAGTRHYVLQKLTPNGPLTVLDQATFSPDTVERWMGSSALDNQGNLAVGYSTSSTTVFPSIAWAGRLANDPPNTLAQGEATMFAGTGVQLGTQNRWGDYTNMSLDPSDDATFWYTNQYQATSPAGGFGWQTRIGKFKYPGTSAPPQGTLSGIITACDTGALLKDALVRVTGGPSEGFSSTTSANGTYSIALSPGNYTVSVINPAHLCEASAASNVTITDGGNTTFNGCLAGAATFLYSSSAIAVSGGDTDGIIEPNECNDINVSILNNGCKLAENISAVLSSSTPGVTVTQPNSPYPATTENGNSVNAVPFSISTSNTFVCGTAINLTLTVNYSGGSNTLTFTLPSCTTPAVTVNGVLDGGDLTQEGRLGRNAIASGCGTAKACPQVLGTGARRYDVHTFVNGPAPACATITTTATGGGASGNIIPAAYLGSYTAPGVGSGGNICINYLGDPGGSPVTSNTFSVNLPANATLAVVVQEANASQPAGSTYSVEVAGLVGNGSGGGTCPPPPTAVSRKTHGAAGTHDIPMPLTGPTGVESRTGNGGAPGNHTIVLTYPTAPTGATASVVARNPSSATGSISNVTVSGNDLIVSLANVSDDQVLTLSVNGPAVGTAVVPIGFLAGDVNANRAVTASDISQVKAHAGPTTGGNFRSDLNASGDVNATDISIAKANAGGTIP